MIFIKPPEKINENNIYFLFFYNYMYICWGVGYNNNYMYNLKLIILGTLSSLKTTFRGGSHLWLLRDFAIIWNWPPFCFEMVLPDGSSLFKYFILNLSVVRVDVFCTAPHLSVVSTWWCHLRAALTSQLEHFLNFKFFWFFWWRHRLPHPISN